GPHRTPSVAHAVAAAASRRHADRQLATGRAVRDPRRAGAADPVAGGLGGLAGARGSLAQRAAHAGGDGGWIRALVRTFLADRDRDGLLRRGPARGVSVAGGVTD